MPKKKASSKYHVLIVEDEPRLVDALRRKFEHHGFTVDVAVNGEEGLRKMSERVFDFILADLLMPRMDGFGLLEEKPKTKNADTPVCVLTVIGQEQNLKRAMDLGAWKCFVKSNTTLTHVLEVIVAELDRRHGKAPA